MRTDSIFYKSEDHQCPLRYDLERGFLSWQPRAAPHLVFDWAIQLTSARGQMMRPSQAINIWTKSEQQHIELKYSFSNGIQVQMDYLAERDSALNCRMRVINHGVQPLYLHKLFPFVLDESRHGSTRIPSPSLLFCLGYQSWTPAGTALPKCANARTILPTARVVALDAANYSRTARDHLSHMAMLLTWQHQFQCLLLGFVEGQKAMHPIRCLLNNRCEEILRLEAGEDLDGRRLKSGEELSGESLHISCAEDPQLLWESYLERSSPRSSSWREKKTVSGWCSWYEFKRDITEKKIEDNIVAVKTKGIPLQVVQIDDGYQVSAGSWEIRNRRFPHGLQYLANKIKDQGLSPGLWVAPFIVKRGARMFREHPDWLIRSGNGKPVSAGFNPVWRGRTCALDPTHPGVQSWLRQFFTRAKHEWGFRFFKLDFLYAAALPGRRHDPDATRAASLSTGLSIIREAVGSDVFLVGCGAPLGPSMGHIDAMRIGADVEAVWQYRSLLWLTGLRSFPSLENALQNVITRAALHRRWWINDPDCLLIRNSRSRLSNAELVTATTVLAMAGGMLMLSDDLPAVPSERLGLALRAIPPTDRSPFIPDLFIREQPSFLRAEQPWGGWLISQINWESSDVRSEPNVQVWGIDPNLFVRVIDVHRGVDLGMCRGQLPQTHLMPHGCILYSLSTLPHAIPKLLACDLHWGGGPETAITTTWNAPNLELKINFELHGRRTGKFFVGYPSRFRVEAIHAANGSIDHIDNSPDQLLVCDVTMSGPAACWVNFSASTDTGTHL